MYILCFNDCYFATFIFVLLTALVFKTLQIERMLHKIALFYAAFLHI